MLKVITGDKRSFQRILFDSPVVLHNGKESYETRLIDISLNGALVKKPAVWHEIDNDKFTLEVSLMDSDAVISMHVETAHEQSNSIGFQCERIDLESISSLRRLVELNLGDEELIERELSALTG